MYGIKLHCWLKTPNFLIKRDLSASNLADVRRLLSTIRAETQQRYRIYYQPFEQNFKHSPSRW